MASLGSVMVIAFALLGAPAAAPRVPSDSGVSLGAGWTVAQIRAAFDAPPGPAAAPTSTERTPEQAHAPTGETATAQTRVAPPSPRVSVRPYAHHSDVDARIKEARRIRALQVGGALAVQGAMLIYGITRAIDNAKEAAIIRDEPPPSQYKPMHPR